MCVEIFVIPSRDRERGVKKDNHVSIYLKILFISKLNKYDNYLKQKQKQKMLYVANFPENKLSCGPM